MEEIKFRAWDVFNADMFPEKQNDDLLVKFFREVNERRNGGNKVHVMQYTGLKDKNGKEIYEGDIVSFVTDRQEIKEFKSKVVFEGGAFVISEGKNYNDTFLCAMTETDSGIKVIGNIYENANLLEAL